MDFPILKFKFKVLNFTPHSIWRDGSMRGSVKLSCIMHIHIIDFVLKHYVPFKS